MKKQILFLAIFSLAIILAGTTKVAAQSLNQGITSTQALPPLTCAGTATPLHPIPGVSYKYSMNGFTGTGGGVSSWTWFATKDPNFISTTGSTTTLNTANRLTVSTGQLLATSANYGIATSSGIGTDSIVNITWSPEILANTLYEGPASTTVFPSPTFVVGYAKGVNCADNIQVYEINPIKVFIIDIANINGTGGTMQWDQDTSQCVDIVRSAAYNSTNDSIMMDYGTDTLYFEVAASNFVKDWTPTFRASGISGSQTATIGIADSYINAKAGTFITGSGTRTWTSTTINTAAADFTSGVPLTAANSAQVAAGVSIWVRVVIDNNSYESLTAQTFKLMVDAIDNSGAAVANQTWDMENDDCSTATYTNAADQFDFAEHIVKPRPTITHQTSDPNPAAPNTIIDKQGNY